MRRVRGTDDEHHVDGRLTHSSENGSPGGRLLYENSEITRASSGDRAAKVTREFDRVIGEKGRPVRVLDVGCGDGGLSMMIQTLPQVGQMVGLDWSLAALREARRLGVTVVQGASGQGTLPFANGTFDVVVMTEVIEHLVDTDNAIAEIRRVLKDSGWLILSTPNLAAWFNRLLLLFGIQPIFSEISTVAIYGRPGRQVVGHLRLFTRRALRDFLDANGFTDVVIVGARFDAIPRQLQWLDTMMCSTPGLASILVTSSRRDSSQN